MSGWTNPLDLLREEFTQRADEGCAIPDRLRQALAELHPAEDRWNRAAIDPLYDELMALPDDPVLAAAEPNELAAIRALRPAGPRDLGWQPSAAELIDRMHGAWTGRFVGCALGKPVEGMGMGRQDGRLVGRANIKRHLQLLGHWPLADYFSDRDAGDGHRLGCPASLRENIAYMEADDDVHYSLVGLSVVEQHGPGFTWRDVANRWLGRIPIHHICTAETQAILNYLNRDGRGGGSCATPAFTRRFRNPYREWIGAQIRADGWAWVCAGKPELAAEFAWRDASWTHERNGIYGEMLFAAIQAAAFAETDPRRLVEIGLSEIPRDCRLARAVRELLAWIDACPDWEACMDRVDARWQAMTPVHTINNALVCIMAMLYGGLDPERTACLAVMGGLDTDCNGATAGPAAGGSTTRCSRR